MCNNAFLLGKTMEQFDVRSRILNGGSQGIHPIHQSTYLRKRVIKNMFDERAKSEEYQKQLKKSGRLEKERAKEGLIPMELKSVQPLAAPTGMLYYLDYKYPNYTLYNDGTIVLKTKRNRKSKLIIL